MIWLIAKEMKKIRNIIFDWSGTLVDDLPAVWRTTNHILSRAGKKEMSLDQFREKFILPFSEFYKAYVPEKKLSELESWWHDYFPTVEHLVEPLPQSKRFLEFVKSESCRTYIFSAIHSKQFELQSERCGFMHLIDAPFIEIDNKVKRIHHLLTHNELDGSETLFIGDMEHDIQAAKSGGVFSCAVLTGYNGLEQLRKCDPDLIVENLNELSGVLKDNKFTLKMHQENKISPQESFGSSDEKSLPNQSPLARPIATVGALIFNSLGNVLMVQTHKWSDLWGIPGGKIELNEPSEEALIREIKEETQLEITNIHFVFVQDCIQSTEFYKPAHFLLLNYTAEVSGKEDVVLNDEAQDHKWVSLEEALLLKLNFPTRKLLEEVKKNTACSRQNHLIQTIKLTGIEVSVSIGVPDWEREIPQLLKIDLEFQFNAGTAIKTDDISSTINYAEVEQHILDYSKTRSWKLLEQYIHELSQSLSRKFQFLSGKIVAHKKVLPGLDRVSIICSF